MTPRVGTDNSWSYSGQGPKICLLHSVHTGRRGTFLFSGCRWYSAHTHLEVQKEWSYTATPLYAAMTCTGSSLLLLLSSLSSSSSSSSLICGSPEIETRFAEVFVIETHCVYCEAKLNFVSDNFRLQKVSM